MHGGTSGGAAEPRPRLGSNDGDDRVELETAMDSHEPSVTSALMSSTQSHQPQQQQLAASAAAAGGGGADRATLPHQRRDYALRPSPLDAVPSVSRLSSEPMGPLSPGTKQRMGYDWRERLAFQRARKAFSDSSVSRVDDEHLGTSSARFAMPAIPEDRAVAENLCLLCACRFHWLCNQKQHCATCKRQVCSDCAPEGQGGLRFCKQCMQDPRQEYLRLSAVLERYPSDAAVWAAVAGEMRDEFSIVKAGGRTYHRPGCYARSIELEPGRKHWAALARALPCGSYVDLDLPGKGVYRLSKMDCYKNALFVRPTDSRVWANLAADLTGTQTIEVDGNVYNRVSAVLHALHLSDHKCPVAWALLGMTIFEMRNRDSLFVDGTRVDTLYCFQRSLQLDPYRASTWNNLASVLPVTNYWIEDEGERARSGACPVQNAKQNAASPGSSLTPAGAAAGGSATVPARPRVTSTALAHAGAASRSDYSLAGREMTHATTTGTATSGAGSLAWRHRLHNTTGISFASGAEGTARNKYDDRRRRRAMPPHITVGGAKFFKIDCAVQAVVLSPNDPRLRFNLATNVCRDHPIDVADLRLSKEDLFRDVLEHASTIRSINLRTQLTMMFPDHPRLKAIDDCYSYDERKLLGSGAYGSVYEATWDDTVSGVRQETLAAKVIENFGVEEHVRTMIDSVDEIRALVDVRFSSRAVVQCQHIRVEPMRDRIVLFLERAVGSLMDRLRHRVLIDPERLTFRRAGAATTSGGPSDAAAAAVGGLAAPSDTQHRHPMSPTTGASFAAFQAAKDEQHGVSANAGAFEYRLHETEIRHSAQRVLFALEEMHQHGAAHQDIKPDNVLLFDDGAIKLGDLGSVAQVRGGKRQPGGTDPYLAPEALREIVDAAYLQRQRELELVDPGLVHRWTVKRDVWSWAALVVHLATGRVPIKTVTVNYDEARDHFAVDFSDGYQPMYPDQAGVPHIPATLSRELRDLLRRCFCPNPADRLAVHELVMDPYFRRKGMPADTEPQALYKHRRTVSRPWRDASCPTEPPADQTADPDWALLYRALPLYGADADAVDSPKLLRAAGGDSAAPAGAGAARLGTPGVSASSGGAARDLASDVLDRIINIAEGDVHMTITRGM